MSDEELFGKFKKVIVETIDCDEDKVTKEASFRGDLGADSLDTYDIVYALEQELEIKISDEDAQEFETVGDAFEYIKTLVK